jgi:hypothetical protein
MRLRWGQCPRCRKPRVSRVKLCRTCKEAIGKVRARTAREREFDQALRDMVREKFGQRP